ncbi:hypothetical protein VitviT2T_013459 [Vitis vinifera]|uniref:FLZ-type domain-containing protein n=1 Tax=Vitis vinifera TaxID=29760 RepID=A0ABY9CHV0_VITVI|nr:uncharacterized protein LOC104880242 isoform X2 [Vitis vinifera]XP_059595792.1 uncharacterized protein LOC104880242 isoform X2 [Vitis vinifera]WJZ94619.1 hypothetical protein VitviT2T_013459 [Vitis vinifera]
MLSEHNNHHFKANCSDCSDKLLKLGKLLRFWPTKPSSIIETGRNCSGIELARGISVIFAEKNSHLLLRHRDVNVHFTVLYFGKSCNSSVASNSLTDTDSQGSVTQQPMPQNVACDVGESSSRPDQPYRRVSSFSSINAGPEVSSSSRASSEKRDAMMIPPDFKKSMRTQKSSVIIPYALDEIWSSEEYTCVVVHGDQKPAVTHIFCDYILECHARWMVGRKRIPTIESLEQITKSPDVPTVQSFDNDRQFILSFCSMCSQRLEKEEDIYMFQGEAFCSPVCRNHAVIIELWAEEGRKVKVDHSSQGPPEPADSDEKNLFTLGIPIIT